MLYHSSCSVGSSLNCFLFFFFNDTATTEIYTLSLHDALPSFGQKKHGPTRRPARRSPHAAQPPASPTLAAQPITAAGVHAFSPGLSAAGHVTGAGDLRYLEVFMPGGSLSQPSHEYRS